MKDLNKILKTKLENYQEAPPKELFNDVRMQYPKRSFFEIINQNKYYIIAAVVSLTVASILLFDNDKPNESESIKETVEQISNNNNNETLIIETENQNENNSIEDKTTVQGDLTNNEPVENRVEYKQIFSFNDTSVCGNSIEINYSDDPEFIISNNLIAEFIDNSIVLSSNTTGSHYIYYKNTIENKTILDSAKINFVKVGAPNVSIKDKTLCFGEDLTINMSPHSEMKPILSNTDFYRYNESTYKISGLKPGENQIQLLFTDKNNCSAEINETILMAENPSYDVISTPAYCSKTNGTITIIPDNFTPIKYTINNSFDSETGIIENINPGIYYVEIEYASNCMIYDTLLVRDSLNLSPFFKIEKNITNDNNYQVQNLTRLDNNGYEVSNEVSFIWKVNGEEYEYKDNPVFTFDSEGEYNIELVAIIDENCNSSYSETIHVSGNCFRIPNIFTPNGDGIGDFFKVISESEINNYNIQIINKLGEIVYESNDINNSWNGKINGNDDASEGLYYYIIRGEDKFENKIEQKGALQLVRN